MNVKINPLKYIVATDKIPTKFAMEVAEGITTIGRSGQYLLKNDNLHYVLAKKTSDVFPELKGVTPRGWPSNMTWDDAPAISPTHLSLVGLFSKPKCADIPSAVRHETGHKLDSFFYRKIGSSFSNTNGYKDSYSDDLTHLNKRMSNFGLEYDDIFYVIQGSTPKKMSEGGLKESFAEFYAMLRGGSIANSRLPGLDEVFPEIFPKTVAYVKKLLWYFGDK